MPARPFRAFAQRSRLSCGHLASRDDAVAAAFYLVDRRPKVRNRESDVIRGRALGAASRRLCAEENEHARKFDDVGVVLPELHCRSAERAGEELDLLLDVRSGHVMMTVDDWAFLRGDQLGRHRWDADWAKRGKHDHEYFSVHFLSPE